MASLKVRYEHGRDDDVGWLELEISTEDFSGRAGAWVQWQDLDEYADTLSLYPITAAAPLRGQWGIDPNESSEPNLGVLIVPANGRGGLNVIVTMASYYPEEMHRLKTHFESGYAELDRFRLSLKQLVRKEAEEAVLAGS